MLLVAAAVVLPLIAPPAAAHAEFVSSFPEPYDILFNYQLTSVRVTVSEAVQAGSASIAVTSDKGVRFDAGPTALAPTDPATFSVGVPGIGPGVYTVVWGATSADDGHFSAGSFYFIIRNPDGTLPGAFPTSGGTAGAPVSPLDVALRGADFIGFAVALGSLLFVLLLWLPARSDLEGAASEDAARAERSLLWLAKVGGAVFLSAVTAQWLENLATTPPMTLAAVFGSTFLLSLALRYVLAVAMVLLVEWDLRRRGGGTRAVERPQLVAAVATGFMAILADVFASHSATVEAWWPLGPFADAIHLYGAVLWVGGLVAILRVRPWLLRSAPGGFADFVLLSFSKMAFLAVGLIVAAGIGLGLVLVGSVDNLLRTGYGWLIVAKSALLVPMVALGAWNHRAVRHAEGRSPATGSTSEVVARVRVEAALGVAILVLAAGLTTVNPAALPPANPLFTLTATAGGLYAILQIVPYPEAPGNYTFSLEAWLVSNGSQYIGVAGTNNTLAFSLGGGTPVIVPLDGPHGPNHFSAVTEAMDAPGAWRVVAHLSLVSGGGVDFAFDVPLRP